MHPFSQIDVFGSAALLGNPVAVVHDADDLDTSQMQAFARWTSLSETTFLLQPTDPDADYRLRIFTPLTEYPFAGHPTLGSAHAWLAAGGVPQLAGRVVQECGAGLVEVGLAEGRPAFRAPGFLRRGAVDDDDLAHVLDALGLDRGRVLGAEWIDNGPGWVGLQLDSAETVLALRPRLAGLEISCGVIGALDDATAAATGAGWEVRAFSKRESEDPVTGSLNAGFGVWLTATGALPPSYVARQGTVLGADGRVHVSTDASGDVWVGGDCRTVVSGRVDAAVAGA